MTNIQDFFSNLKLKISQFNPAPPPTQSTSKADTVFLPKAKKVFRNVRNVQENLNVLSLPRKAFPSIVAMEEKLTTPVISKIMGYTPEQEQVVTNYNIQEAVKEKVGYDERVWDQRLMVAQQEKINQDIQNANLQADTFVNKLSEVTTIEEYNTLKSEIRSSGFTVNEDKSTGQISISKDSSKQLDNWKTKWEKKGFKIDENVDESTGQVSYSISDPVLEKRLSDLDKPSVQTGKTIWSDSKVAEKLRKVFIPSELEQIEAEQTKASKFYLGGGAFPFYAKTFGVGALQGSAVALAPPYGAYLISKGVYKTATNPMSALKSVTVFPEEIVASSAGFVTGGIGTSILKTKLWTQPSVKSIDVVGETMKTGKGKYETKQFVSVEYQEAWLKRILSDEQKVWTKQYEVSGSLYDVPTKDIFGNTRQTAFADVEVMSLELQGDKLLQTKVAKGEAISVLKGVSKTDVNLFGSGRHVNLQTTDYVTIAETQMLNKVSKLEKVWSNSLDVVRVDQKNIGNYKYSDPKYSYGYGKIADVTKYMDAVLEGTSYYYTPPEYTYVKNIKMAGRGNMYTTSNPVPIEGLISYKDLSKEFEAPPVNPSTLKINQNLLDASNNIINKVNLKPLGSSKSGSLGVVNADIIVEPSLLSGGGNLIGGEVGSTIIKSLTSPPPIIESLTTGQFVSGVGLLGNRVVNKHQLKIEQEQKKLTKMLTSTAVTNIFEEGHLYKAPQITRTTQAQAIITQTLTQQVPVLEIPGITAPVTVVPITPPEILKPRFIFDFPIDPVTKLKKSKKKKKKKVRGSYAPSLRSLFSGYAGERPNIITGLRARPASKRTISMVQAFNRKGVL